MTRSISASTKKRGRPPTTGKGVQVGVRFQPADLAKLDKFIASQSEPRPTRPEAIREIVKSTLDLVEQGNALPAQDAKRRKKT